MNLCSSLTFLLITVAISIIAAAAEEPKSVNFRDLPYIALPDEDRTALDVDSFIETVDRSRFYIGFRNKPGRADLPPEVIDFDVRKSSFRKQTAKPFANTYSNGKAIFFSFTFHGYDNQSAVTGRKVRKGFFLTKYVVNVPNYIAVVDLDKMVWVRNITDFGTATSLRNALTATRVDRERVVYCWVPGCVVFNMSSERPAGPMITAPPGFKTEVGSGNFYAAVADPSYTAGGAQEEEESKNEVTSPRYVYILRYTQPAFVLVFQLATWSFNLGRGFPLGDKYKNPSCASIPGPSRYIMYGIAERVDRTTKDIFKFDIFKADLLARMVVGNWSAPGSYMRIVGSFAYVHRYKSTEVLVVYNLTDSSSVRYEDGYTMGVFNITFGVSWMRSGEVLFDSEGKRGYFIAGRDAGGTSSPLSLIYFNLSGPPVTRFGPHDDDVTTTSGTSSSSVPTTTVAAVVTSPNTSMTPPTGRFQQDGVPAKGPSSASSIHCSMTNGSYIIFGTRPKKTEDSRLLVFNVETQTFEFSPELDSSVAGWGAFQAAVTVRVRGQATGSQSELFGVFAATEEGGMSAKIGLIRWSGGGSGSSSGPTLVARGSTTALNQSNIVSATSDYEDDASGGLSFVYFAHAPDRGQSPPSLISKWQVLPNRITQVVPNGVCDFSAGEGSAGPVIVVQRYVIAGLNKNPGRIIRCEKATMERVDAFRTPGMDNIAAFATDGHGFLYAGSDTEQGFVYKFSMVDGFKRNMKMVGILFMSTSKTIMGNVVSMAYEGSYLFVGTVAQRVMMVNASGAGGLLEQVVVPPADDGFNVLSITTDVPVPPTTQSQPGRGGGENSTAGDTTATTRQILMHIPQNPLILTGNCSVATLLIPKRGILQVGCVNAPAKAVKVCLPTAPDCGEGNWSWPSSSESTTPTAASHTTATFTPPTTTPAPNNNTAGPTTITGQLSRSNTSSVGSQTLSPNVSTMSRSLALTPSPTHAATPSNTSYPTHSERDASTSVTDPTPTKSENKNNSATPSFNATETIHRTSASSEQTPSLRRTRSASVSLTDTIHAPPEKSTVRQIEEVMQSVGAAVSAISMPSATMAMGMGRQQSVSRLLDGSRSGAGCGFVHEEGPLAWAQSPTRLEIEGAGRFRFVVGAVVGNVALTMGTAVLFMLVSFTYQTVTGVCLDSLIATAVQSHVSLCFLVFVALLFGPTLFYGVGIFFQPYIEDRYLALVGFLGAAYLGWIAWYLRRTLWNQSMWSICFFEYEQEKHVPGYVAEEKEQKQSAGDGSVQHHHHHHHDLLGVHDKKKEEKEGTTVAGGASSSELLIVLDSDDDLPPPPPAAAATPADVGDDNNKKERSTIADKLINHDDHDDDDDDDLAKFIDTFVLKDLTRTQVCLLRFKQFVAYWTYDFGIWKYDADKATREQRLSFHFAFPILESYTATVPLSSRFFAIELAVQTLLVLGVLCGELVSTDKSCKVEGIISVVCMALFFVLLVHWRPLQPRIALFAATGCTGLQAACSLLATIANPGADWLQHLEVVLLVAQTMLTVVLFLWFAHRIYWSASRRRLFKYGTPSAADGENLQLATRLDEGDSRRISIAKLLAEEEDDGDGVGGVGGGNKKTKNNKKHKQKNKKKKGSSSTSPSPPSYSVPSGINDNNLMNDENDDDDHTIELGSVSNNNKNRSRAPQPPTSHLSLDAAANFSPRERSDNHYSRNSRQASNKDDDDDDDAMMLETNPTTFEDIDAALRRSAHRAAQSSANFSVTTADYYDDDDEHRRHDGGRSNESKQRQEERVLQDLDRVEKLRSQLDDMMQI